MLCSYVVLTHNPQAHSFTMRPCIAATPEQAMGLIGQHLTETGSTDLLVGAFTREQLTSSLPLFDQMDVAIEKHSRTA